MVQKSTLRVYDQFRKTITMANNPKLSGYVLGNLSTIIDSLSSEGQHALISNMKMNFLLTSEWEWTEHTGPMGIYFGIMQTAGTVIDSTSSSKAELTTLDSMTNDVFGFQRISTMKMQESFYISPKTALVMSDIQTMYKIKGQVNIPQNVLALLNKENETERLQDLYLIAMVINTIPDTQSMLDVIESIDYSLKRKKITIR